MTDDSNEAVVRRYVQAHQDHDYEAIGSLRHRDWTAEWPQSGERVRGHSNDRAIMDNWPGGRPSAGEVRIVGGEDRWVMTPLFTVHRVVGAGDSWWADGTASYPDGSTWFAAALLELRDQKLYRETWYFGPPLEAAEWRSAWVERTNV
jgi:hypothetical protein